MTDEQFAEKIEDSGFLKNYAIETQKEKALGVIRSFHNHSKLLKTEEKLNDELVEKFKGTGYISKNNCIYAVSFKGKNKTQKLLCNFVA
ncbi:MAG: hypothetical protein LBI41_03185 [Lactobacillales bacterium]|jgi:hypothetical protein|nr:hypothetical protein [Lactobacillales bacterium]